MKRTLSFLLALTMLMLCAVISVNAAEPVNNHQKSSPSGEEPPILSGDADMDGDLTILDATCIQRFLADLIGGSELNLSACDFDNDGDVTIIDATAIQRRLAGLDKLLRYNGFLYRLNPDTDTVEICGYIGEDTDITIPYEIDGKDVTAICDNAFENHTELTSVTFYSGDDLHLIIGACAFRGCTGLKTARLPFYGLRGLGRSAFDGCTSLESANLSYNIDEIPERAFADCRKLQSISVPGCIRKIGDSAFDGCLELSEVTPTVDADKIGNHAFDNCPKLKKIISRSKTAEIGAEAFGFYDGKKVDGFMLYGYTDSTVKQYADENGVAFKSIDTEGPIYPRQQEDVRTLPEQCGSFDKKATAIYVTSKAELKEALDKLYDGNRDQDKYTYQPETYDDAWFDSHDILAVRVFMKNAGDYLYVPYLGLDYDDNLIVDIDRIYNRFDSDGQKNWRIVLISFDTLGYRPEILLSESYDYEMVEKKPIIYLYPEEETELTVTVGKPENLTCTYPAYNGGWHITAKPDGTLIDDSGRSYYALYWEGISNVPVSNNDGFVVKGEDTARFFEEKLALLGLTEREAQEFIVYWLPQLQNNEYNFIRFATMDEIEAIMPLSFSVQPDALIRVLMEYKPLDEPIEVAPQTLTAPERKGFTAVEWGGCLLS